MNKHLHLLAKVALLALLAAAFASTPAAADEIQDLIKRYGFEYRKDEVPYGVPVKAKLSEVKLGEITYSIDRASPLDEAGMKGVIKAYLLTHASNEIALISRLLGGPVRKVRVDVGKASTTELAARSYEPYLKHFRVYLAPIVEKGETFVVHCDFKFIPLGGKFYASYYLGEFDRRKSEQPSCDMSSDKTKSPM